MTLGSKLKTTKEILTSISLVGCFLNILTLVHDLYIFENKDYSIESVYLITISCTTLICLYGILKLREGELDGFKFYLLGQAGELLFYIIILVLVTIPEYKDRIKIDSVLATVGFLKNTLPLLLMTVLHYFYMRKIKPIPK